MTYEQEKHCMVIVVRTHEFLICTLTRFDASYSKAVKPCQFGHFKWEIYAGWPNAIVNDGSRLSNVEW